MNELQEEIHDEVQDDSTITLCEADSHDLNDDFATHPESDTADVCDDQIPSTWMWCLERVDQLSQLM